MPKYNIFYLHPCARSSAGWLKDDDINRAWVMSYRTLCDAALMATLGDAGTILPGPYEIQRNPYVRWALQSCWNYEWLYQYYITLCDISRDIDEVKPNHFLTTKEIHAAKVMIPHLKFTPPAIELNEGLMLFENFDAVVDGGISFDGYVREIYLSSVKASSYRKVARPFWMPQLGHSGMAWRKLSQQKSVSKAKSADEIPTGPGVDPRDPFGIMAESP